MITANSPKWYHSNVYNAESACKECGEVIRHNPWCSEVNSVVRYARQIVMQPEAIDENDTLRLHALGVTWYIRH